MFEDCKMLRKLFGPSDPKKKYKLQASTVYNKTNPNVTAQVLSYLTPNELKQINNVPENVKQSAREMRKKRILENLKRRENTIVENINKYIENKNPNHLKIYTIGNLASHATRSNWLQVSINSPELNRYYISLNGKWHSIGRRQKPLTKNMILENILKAAKHLPKSNSK